ncbi:unnamed protein product [Clonostachys chloroleuca]|uniref:Uncharacterized protein n=1 Tax=Clonostachys chloroleuca TaxID=1926264 RepID=A0AA35PZ03_9HYPO|nr:unnamed protein product [Clonostachys chloroleuca]
MCFELVTHRTDCETRRISTLSVKQPEFAFDIYHPFEWPPNCDHYTEGRIGDVCLSHGNCCELSYREVCVYWVGHGEGIIKCRGFNRRLHIVVPGNGSNDEVDTQFRDPVDDAVRLTEAEEERLYQAQVAYIDVGVRVRTVLEDSGSAWITNVNPPYDWRTIINTGANGRLLLHFDAAERGWKRVCPTLKKEENPLQSEAMKDMQSQYPYWYKVFKVPRSGNEGPPNVGPDGSSIGQTASARSYGQFASAKWYGQPAPAQSSASGAGGDGVAAAVMVGGLINPPGGDQNGPVAKPVDESLLLRFLFESSEEYVPYSPSEGPTRIFSRSPGEGNDAVLEGDDDQGPPVAPPALGGLAPAAVLGDGLAGGHAQVPFGEVYGQVYGEAQAAVQALANPQWSVEQLSAMRDAIVQQSAETAPGVRVENDLVGIPVTGMVWLPAQGLLNRSLDDEYYAEFYLDNDDGHGHHREEDGILRLPAPILGRLLSNVLRDIPQAILPQANLPQVHLPQVHPLQANLPQVHIPQANPQQANIRPEDIPWQSVEDENGDGPPMSPLTDPDVTGGSGEGSRPLESGESQRGGEGESSTNTNTTRRPSGEGDSSTNTNTTRRSGGNQGIDERPPPIPSPNYWPSPLPEPGNEANGSRHSGSLPPANPSILREEGNSEEGTTGVLSDMSTGALQRLEKSLDAAGSSVPRKTRKRAAEEEEEEVEEEPAPPRPTGRQPVKRRRVETAVEEPVDGGRYKFRQRRKVNYKYK